MNPLYNASQQVPFNAAEFKDNALRFVKSQIESRANPDFVIQQILQRNPRLNGLLQQYGARSYSELAQKMGYNVNAELQKIGM